MRYEWLLLQAVEVCSLYGADGERQESKEKPNQNNILDFPGVFT
jgi:hypothetical protein